jgi:hypothetical protein
VTDHSTFLLRLRLCTGTQPFSVLGQLPRYSSIPLFVGLSNNAGYKTPVNNDAGYNTPGNNVILGVPYLYFGFLPIRNASNNNVQGLLSNGISVNFTNGDKTPYSYFALFPNFAELQPTKYSLTIHWPFCDKLFDTTLLQNPSTRVMPPDFFMFLETHWGGGGCYSQTDSRLAKKCILGASIGFR